MALGVGSGWVCSFSLMCLLAENCCPVPRGSDADESNESEPNIKVAESPQNQKQRVERNAL